MYIYTYTHIYTYIYIYIYLYIYIYIYDVLTGRIRRLQADLRGHADEGAGGGPTRKAIFRFTVSIHSISSQYQCSTQDVNSHYQFTVSIHSINSRPTVQYPTHRTNSRCYRDTLQFQFTEIHIHQSVCTVSDSKQVYCILNNWCICIDLSCGGPGRHAGRRQHGQGETTATHRDGHLACSDHIKSNNTNSSNKY